MGQTVLFFYSAFTAFLTLILIAAGGLVTSTGSGLSVPDWPLSYGMLFPPMIGGIRFEHTHRLIAGSVGIFTLILSVWIWKQETRRSWMRTLAVIAFLAVLAQAILGGLTVKFLLPRPISVGHACLGQTFFSLVCLITLFLSKEWRSESPAPSSQADVFFRLACTTTAFAYLQLIAGSVVRHTGGQYVLWHFFIAFFILIHAFFLSVKVFRYPELRRLFLSQTLLFTVFLFLQIFLGLGTYILKFVIEKAPTPRVSEVLFATAHQTLGALILANFFILSFRAKRFLTQSAQGYKTSDYLDLVKLRVTLAALATTFAGYILGATQPILYPRLFHTLLGAFLIGAGGNAINQYLERDVDRLMPRTQNRPLPQGRLKNSHVILFGLVTFVAGFFEIMFFVSPFSAWIGCAIFISYAFIYTPLKRITPLNTFVGAVPGALPAVLGWVSAGGNLGPQAAALFILLFVWQIPHFYAIAWIYKKDYALAGLKMRPVTDVDGRRTAFQILFFTILLILASLLPFRLGFGGNLYAGYALVSGAGFLFISSKLIRSSMANAKQYVTGSVLYILTLLVILVVDKR